MSTVLTTTQFAIRLRESGRYPTASATSVMRWIEKGYIKGYRPGPGTRYQIPESEVERFLNSSNAQPGGDDAEEKRRFANQHLGSQFMTSNRGVPININVPIDYDKLRAFCRRWHITSFAFFGSVLREDFRPDSDIDVLVAFDPAARITLITLAEIADELEAMFGRQVDLVERRWVEHSHNPIRRHDILTTAQEVYRAAA